LTIVSRPALGPTEPPIQWVLGGGGGAWSSIWCRSQECVVLYLHSPIRLHGV